MSAAAISMARRCMLTSTKSSAITTTRRLNWCAIRRYRCSALHMAKHRLQSTDQRANNRAAQSPHGNGEYGPMAAGNPIL